MSRKTAFRGVPSLIFVLVLGLTLAGASPAAAEGLWDFSFDRLVSGFWSEVTGWLTGTDKATSGDVDELDRGFGIDPNGNTVAVEPEPSHPVGPQGQAGR